MSAKASAGRFFEDFEVGQRLDHLGARTITEGDNALYIGLTGDRFPLYCDAEIARALGYPREHANDLLVFHLIFGQTVADISLNAVANLGYAGVRFLQPVFAGDTLRASSEVIGKKENSSGKNGNVYVRTQGENQRGETVLEFYRWVMIRKSGPATMTGEKIVPDLPAAVEPAELVVDDSLDLSAPGRSLGPWYFEDYAPGELILHGSGMTITESEHATATRLYQNTAKVHFDGHAMQSTPAGKRLMYGGHVISVARALSYNGLENALRVLAWNGGAHTNPTYAGDTLFAMTEVLSVDDIPGRHDVGALRTRLIAVKNQDPQGESLDIKISDEKTGRESYHTNVVLDLDYWLLVPKRQGQAPS